MFGYNQAFQYHVEKGKVAALNTAFGLTDPTPRKSMQVIFSMLDHLERKSPKKGARGLAARSKKRRSKKIQARLRQTSLRSLTLSERRGEYTEV